MPFAVGIGEMLLLLIAIGIVVGVPLVIYRRLAPPGSSRHDELEEAKRDFEREIERMKRHEQLPRG